MILIKFENLDVIWITLIFEIQYHGKNSCDFHMKFTRVSHEIDLKLT